MRASSSPSRPGVSDASTSISATPGSSRSTKPRPPGWPLSVTARSMTLIARAASARMPPSKVLSARLRASPFYMMDEVEAALDDVNLQRFLSLVDEFRHEAQLLIVTHQKRTMESADALYGVTMVPGASSKVVSQRVKKSPEEVLA